MNREIIAGSRKGNVGRFSPPPLSRKLVKAIEKKDEERGAVISDGRGRGVWSQK
jgi:hypothetical protein